MGIKLFSSGDGYDMYDNTSPNPNKFRFDILQIEAGENWDIVLVEYPDCTTFDGQKLLLVVHGTITKDMNELDPHFFEDSVIFARFKPDKKGLELARKLQLCD